MLILMFAKDASIISNSLMKSKKKTGLSISKLERLRFMQRAWKSPFSVLDNLK